MNPWTMTQAYQHIFRFQAVHLIPEMPKMVYIIINLFALGSRMVSMATINVRWDVQVYKQTIFLLIIIVDHQI